jgi:TrbC/VIRB2 family pilin
MSWLRLAQPKTKEDTMRERATHLAAAVAAALGGLALAPASVGAAGGGRGNVSQLGNHAAQLLQEILGPIIIVMVACVGLVAFMRREIGLAVTAAAIALFLGLFVFAPHTAQSLIEGFWKRVA